MYQKEGERTTLIRDSCHAIIEKNAGPQRGGRITTAARRVQGEENLETSKGLWPEAPSPGARLRSVGGGQISF